eukprot:8773213-Pyramimonas_sp.AAC.1
MALSTAGMVEPVPCAPARTGYVATLVVAHEEPPQSGIVDAALPLSCLVRVKALSVMYSTSSSIHTVLVHVGLA